MQHGDAGPFEPRQDAIGAELLGVGVRPQAQRRAARQRRENLAQHHIERKPRQLRMTVPRADAKLPTLPRHEVTQAAVNAEHGLRNARRARREKDVRGVAVDGQVAGMGVGRRGVRGFRLGREPGDGAQSGRELLPFAISAARQKHVHGPRFIEHQPLPLNREAPVQRQQHAAAQQHGDHADDAVDSGGSGDRHHIARVDTSSAQPRRDGARAAAKHAVGHDHAVLLEGGRVGRLVCPLENQLRNGRHRQLLDRSRGVGQHALRIAGDQRQL